MIQYRKSKTRCPHTGKNENMTACSEHQVVPVRTWRPGRFLYRYWSSVHVRRLNKLDSDVGEEVPWW